MRLAFLAAIGAVALALSVAGCSAGPASDSYDGGPRNADPSSAALSGDGAFGSDDSPLVVWNEGRESFSVTNWGSGSCPDRAESIKVDSAHSLTVTFRRDDHEQCTMDISPFTHEFTLPTEETERPLTVTVRTPKFADDYWTSTRTLE